MADVNPTDRIFLRDAHLRDAQCRAFDATVVAVDDEERVALDATAFYATSGGQPHDTGTLSFHGGSASVTDVRGHDVLWHTLNGPGSPAVGADSARRATTCCEHTAQRPRLPGSGSGSARRARLGAPHMP